MHHQKKESPHDSWPLTRAIRWVRSPAVDDHDIANGGDAAPERLLTKSDMGSPLASMSMASAAILVLMSSLVDKRFFFLGSGWSDSPLPSVCNTAAQLTSVLLVAACCRKEEAWPGGQVSGVQRCNTGGHATS